MEEWLAPVEDLDQQQVVADLVEEAEVRLEAHHPRPAAEAARAGVAVRAAEVAGVRRLDDEARRPGAEDRPRARPLPLVEVEVREPLPGDAIAGDVVGQCEKLAKVAPGRHVALARSGRRPRSQK